MPGYPIARYLLHIVFLYTAWLWSSPAFACPARDCIRIATWNIEWFGTDQRPQPVTDNTVLQIANLITNELAIDVIALQEINTSLTGNIHHHAYSLEAWHRLARILAERGYSIQAGESGYSQHLVVAWREPVTVLSSPEDLPVPESYEIDATCHASRLRKPLAGEFRAGALDFQLVAVHLKSEAGVENCSRRIRQAQIDALVTASQNLVPKNKALIILGDFNALLANPVLGPLSQAGLSALDQRHRLGAGSAKASFIHARKGSSPSIDHLFANPAMVAAWHTGSSTIYKPADPEQFLATFSDHVPVWADFSTKAPATSPTRPF